MYIEDTENVRKWALGYGLTFADTYQDAPFHDPNWQLVRVKQSRKAFLWTYEKDGRIHLNLKTTPDKRDFYRSVYYGWKHSKRYCKTDDRRKLSGRYRQSNQKDL